MKASSPRGGPGAANSTRTFATVASNPSLTATGGDDEEAAAASAAAPPREGRVTLVTDLSGYDGISLNEKVDAFTRQHGVVMVNRSWCLFSVDAMDFLVQMGVHVHTLEVDTHPQGSLIRKYLSDKYKHRTTPFIFISGKFLGGFEDVNAMYATGALQSDYLAGLTNKEKCEKMAQLSTRRPLFWFPGQVNGKAVRCTGILTCLAATACVVASHLAPWGGRISYGLALDFAARVLAGSRLSVLGRAAAPLALCLEPEPRAGRPKQFASMCGLMFSLLGALFYFFELPIVGSIWIAGLAVASGMEGFLDFCLGCVFFRIGIQLGIIPK